MSTSTAALRRHNWLHLQSDTVRSLTASLRASSCIFLHDCYSRAPQYLEMLDSASVVWWYQIQSYCTSGVVLPVGRTKLFMPSERRAYERRHAKKVLAKEIKMPA